MNRIFYWRSWKQPYQLIFWILLAIFFALVMVILALQLIGTESLLNWHVFTQESSYTVDYNVFAKGPFSFSIEADKKILTEFFVGGDMPATTFATKVLMAIIAVGLLLYLTLVTILKRVWYLIAMAGLLVFLILLHVEGVQLFGLSGTKVLIIIFILLLTPSYYLHAFNSNAGFTKRLWILAGALALLGGAIYLYSDALHPFANLLTYGLVAPYILILLFVITVAHEIVAAFVNVISGTEGIADSTKMRHFLLITVIYLINILLSYLSIAHYIDWQLWYVNPFLLLVVSAILGIWGSRARASLYSGASSLESLWTILYLVIAIVSLGTLAFLMFALNDPIIKVIGDFIIYAHLAIGIAFLLYVLYNFIPLIEGGHDVGRILYNPTNLPYLSYRLMAIMMIVALFAMRGFDYPIWYSVGGYYNAKGDLALENDYLDVGEAYFLRSDTYAYHNHKANYSLGLIYAAIEPAKAIEYFAMAVDMKPTSQAFLNKSNLQNGQQEYYQALSTLQEGSDIIKNNSHIYNNLALQFDKVKVVDSAFYYLQLAGTNNTQVNNNRLAFSAKYNWPIGKDSAAVFSNLDRAGKANASAHGYIEDIPSMATANHMFDMVILNNWLLTEAPQVNDSSLYRAKTTIDSTSNNDYREQLLYSWSLAAYRAGNLAQAIEELSLLGFNSTVWSGRAKLTLGRIYIQLGSYQQAIDIFQELNYNQLSLQQAVALLENGDPEKAFSFWQESTNVEDNFLSEIADEILSTVYHEDPALDTDKRRYLRARYNRFFIDETAENKLLREIKDFDLRIDLALDLTAFYHDFANPQGASLMLMNIEGLKLSLEQYRRYIILKALVHQESENVQQQLIEFDTLYSFTDKEYILENTLNHLAGMALDSLSYLQMAQDNPFIPDAILIGASYFDNDDDPFRSYSFHAKAVQINPDSPLLMKAYILKALDVGLNQFAENALYEYRQRFSGQSYIILKNEYDLKLEEQNNLDDLELLE